MKNKNKAKFYWGVLENNSIGIEYIPYKHEECIERGTPFLIPAEYVIHRKVDSGEEHYVFSQKYTPVVMNEAHCPIYVRSNDIHIEKHCPSKFIYDSVRHPVAMGSILCILYSILLLSILLPLVTHIIEPEQMILVPLVAIACYILSIVFGIKTMLKILKDNYTYTADSYTLCIDWNRKNLKSLKKFRKCEKFC